MVMGLSSYRELKTIEKACETENKFSLLSDFFFSHPNSSYMMGKNADNGTNLCFY